MNEIDMLNLIEREVNDRQPAAFHLNVVRGDIRRDGNWWYVVVKPDKADVRLSDYSRVLSAVEDAVEGATDESVLLVPALPD